MFANDSAHNASMENSLFGGHSTEGQTHSGNRQISLSKSKEYTQLASQIPHIFGVKDGKPELTATDSGYRDILQAKKLVKPAAGLLTMRARGDKAKGEAGKALQKLSRAAKATKEALDSSQLQRYGP